MNAHQLLTCLGLLLALAMGTRESLAEGFTLRSQSLTNGQAIRPEHYWNDFGCSGKNLMPDLAWTNAPKGTNSFAITFYDMDAPTGSGFWHWVAYDIPGDVRSLPGGVNGGALPPGLVEGNTDLSKPGFFGPCPPVGRRHRYVYTVHALKVEKLPVSPGASPALVGFILWQNTLGTATLQVAGGPRKN